MPDTFLTLFRDARMLLMRTYRQQTAEFASIPTLAKRWSLFWRTELPVPEDGGCIAPGLTAAAFAERWSDLPLKAYFTWLTLCCSQRQHSEIFKELDAYCTQSFNIATAVDLTVVNDCRLLLKAFQNAGFPVPGHINKHIVTMYRNFRLNRRPTAGDVDYLGNYNTIFQYTEDNHHFLKLPRSIDLQAAYQQGVKRAMTELDGRFVITNLKNGFTCVSNKNYNILVRRLAGTHDNKIFFVIIGEANDKPIDILDVLKIGPSGHQLVKAPGHPSLYYIPDVLDSKYFCIRVKDTGQKVKFIL